MVLLLRQRDHGAGQGRTWPPPWPWARGQAPTGCPSTHVVGNVGAEFLAEAVDRTVHPIIHVPKVPIHRDPLLTPAPHDCRDGTGTVAAVAAMPGAAGAELDLPLQGSTGSGSPTFDRMAEEPKLHGQADQVVDEGHGHFFHAFVVHSLEMACAALQAPLNHSWGTGAFSCLCSPSPNDQAPSWGALGGQPPSPCAASPCLPHSLLQRSLVFVS